MTRSFPRLLIYIGIPITATAWALAGRLVWEQTVWTWERGPQMVGFTLIHTGLVILLLIGLYIGLIWFVLYILVAIKKKNLGGRTGKIVLICYILALLVISTPYGFWQRAFINRFTPEQSIELFTYAAASGDLKTVKAFLEHGVDINAQDRNGTALHGAAVEGNLEVMEFLIAHGADVNALNPYGDSPMANARDAQNNRNEAQALLAKHGGSIIRGSEEQRNRVIEEQVRRDIEEMDKLAPTK